MFTQIQVSEVASVYSGRDGKCCCGCAGKHYHRAGQATDSYQTVNNGQVTRVLRLFAANPELVEYEAGSNHAALVLGTRLHIVYFTQAAIEARAAASRSVEDFVSSLLFV